MRRRPSRIHGLLVVDKPSGMTSHDVVSVARRTLDERRIGHAGTLDPDATGILLLGVGNATRLLRFLTALPKVYETEIVFGTTTDTLDDSGEITATYGMGEIQRTDVRAAVEELTGVIEQVPPMVSAVRVDGRRLYELAREGVEVKRTAREVVVHSFDVEPTGDPLVWAATIVCGSGTYVRVLGADLGAKLGGGAHIRRLRRTRSGSFTSAEATALDAFELRPIEHVMRDFESVVVDSEVAESIRNGGFLLNHPDGPGPWAVLDRRGSLIAVHERNEQGLVRPGVVLPPPA